MSKIDEVRKKSEFSRRGDFDLVRNHLYVRTWLGARVRVRELACG